MGMRRKAREFALKALYEWDFDHDKGLLQTADRLQKENDLEVDVMHFLSPLLEAFAQNHEVIDSAIEEYSSHWKLSRMASVDRNILRLGVAEIIFFADVPRSVSINEYLEIAKKFGTEESSSFINGILDKIKKS